MREDLLSLLAEHPRIVFFVFTNGLMIDEEIAGRLAQHRNIVPLLSLEGDEEATDARRGPGTFERVQAVAGTLSRHGVFFGTSLTLTRENFEMLTGTEYVGELVRAGARFFLYLEYTPVTEVTREWTLLPSQWLQFDGRERELRRRYPALFIGVPWDEIGVGGCLSAGRGFVHVNAAGEVEPCPFAPFAETNIRESSLLEALQSPFLARIRKHPELAIERGEGCILWKEREKVKLLLNDSGERSDVEQPSAV